MFFFPKKIINRGERVRVAGCYRWGNDWRFPREPLRATNSLISFPLYSGHVLSKFYRLSNIKEAMVERKRKA